MTQRMISAAKQFVSCFIVLPNVIEHPMPPASVENLEALAPNKRRYSASGASTCSAYSFAAFPPSKSARIFSALVSVSLSPIMKTRLVRGSPIALNLASDIPIRSTTTSAACVTSTFSRLTNLVDPPPVGISIRSSRSIAVSQRSTL